MATLISREHAEELSALKLALQRWRTGGRPGNKIPPPIWDRSIALAAQLGVTSVAKQVGLDHTLLKSKVDAPPRTSGLEMASFVELFPSLPTQERHLSNCVIDIHPARGGRVRVELGGLDVRDLSALLHDLAG